MLTISVFVASDPPQGEDAHTLKVVEAVAARFPGEVAVEVLPITGEKAEALGLRLSPTVVEGGLVLSVGEPLSAGRLKRYVEAQLREQSAS